MPDNFFKAEEILETGKSLINTTGTQVVKQINTTMQTAVSQVAGTGSTNESQSGNQQNQNSGKQDGATNDFIKDLYGKSSSNQTAQPQQGTAGSQQPQTQEEAEKLAKLRKQLIDAHNQSYYIPTFEPAQQKEETVTERIENEEQEKKEKEFMEFQKKQKDNEVPLAVKMAHKTEKHPGASG